MKNFLIPLSAFALLLLQPGLSIAGVMSLRSTRDGAPTNEVTVGDSIKVTVALDELNQAKPVLWAVRVTMPTGFSTPDTIEFSQDAASFGLDKFTGLPVSSAGGLAAILFPSPVYAPSSFSFQTTALESGSWTFEAFGFSVLKSPSNPWDLVMGLRDTLTVNVAPGDSSGESPPPAVVTPEPGSVAIFAGLAVVAGCRRRRR